MFKPQRLALVAALALTGCGGIGTITFASYPNATIAVTPQVTTLAVGSSTTFTASVTNDPDTPFWNLGGYLLVTPQTSLGTLNGQASSVTVNAGSVTYAAPSTPPIYTGGLPSEQGTVVITGNVSTGLLSGVGAAQTIHILAPSVTVGLTPATASVSVGTTNYQTFLAYAVGAANNGVTLQVNGITGGNSTVGTISVYGVYTAPATLPMSGSTVTITLISTADPTKTATATVTLH